MSVTTTPPERPALPKDCSPRISMSKRVRYVLVERLVYEVGRNQFKCQYCEGIADAYNAQSMRHLPVCVLR